MTGRPRWPIILASVPLWPILWLLVFASLARVKLGYWPAYDQPDPKTLHWQLLDVPIFPLIFLAPAALLTSLVFALYGWYAGRRDWRFLLTVITFLILIVWLRLDPGGFFEWWID